jgi:hypothetical protein
MLKPSGSLMGAKVPEGDQRVIAVSGLGLGEYGYFVRGCKRMISSFYRNEKKVHVFFSFVEMTDANYAHL